MMNSPYVSPNATLLKLELDDVLDASYLHSGNSSRSHSSPDGSEAEVASELRNVSALTKTKKPSPPKTTGLSDLSRWDRIPIGAFRSSSTTTGQYFVAASPPSHPQRGPINASTSRIFLPFGATASSALRGSRSSLSHTLSSSNITSTTKRAIEKRMLKSPIFGPSFVEVAPKSRKVKRKEKKAQSSTTATVTSPKTSTIVARNNRNGTAPHVPLSSPFLAPPPPSSTDAYDFNLHSPLFGATVPSSSLHRT